MMRHTSDRQQYSTLRAAAVREAGTRPHGLRPHGGQIIASINQPLFLHEAAVAVKQGLLTAAMLDSHFCASPEVQDLLTELGQPILDFRRGTGVAVKHSQQQTLSDPACLLTRFTRLASTILYCRRGTGAAVIQGLLVAVHDNRGDARPTADPA